jgi:hypothetical protein
MRPYVLHLRAEIAEAVRVGEVHAMNADAISSRLLDLEVAVARRESPDRQTSDGVSEASTRPVPQSTSPSIAGVGDSDPRERNFTSYSQCGEDRIIYYLLTSAGRNISDVRYVDIGAALPRDDNNTYLLYELGARGLLVEADERYTKTYAVERPRDSFVHGAIVPRTFSDASVDLFLTRDRGWQAISAEHFELARVRGKADDETKTVSVTAVHLDNLLEIHFANSSPDVFSIDIEGIEDSILGDLDFSRFRPAIVITERSVSRDGKKFARANKALWDARGYSIYAETIMNSILVSKEFSSQIVS